MFAILCCVSAPVDTPPSLGSFADNQLCGVGYRGGYREGTYTTEGITKLCEALKGSAMTSLKCATTSSVCFVSAPLDTTQHPPLLLCSHARSMRDNGLGPEGGAALAEGLKGNSMLQSLEYATRRSNQPPSVCLSVSAP